MESIQLDRSHSWKWNSTEQVIFSLKMKEVKKKGFIVNAKKLDRQLVAYGTAAGAVLFGAAGADAAVIHTAADLTYGTGNFYLDMNDDAVNDFRFENSVSTTSTGENILWGLNGAQFWVYDGNEVENVESGVAVSSGRPFGAGHFLHLFSSSGLGEGQFGTPGYIGVRFDPAAGSDWLYGWIHIDSVAGDYESYHIDGYAYETSGGSITAGAVPEPTSLAMLACGAAGIFAIRRQYKKV